MLRSLNTVQTGLLGHQSRLDIIGSNIVNVNTTGFKAARASFRALLGERMGLSSECKLGDGVGIDSIDTFMNQGELEVTGIGMDLAIEGDGFFAVNMDGRQIYSRAGNFALDSEGRIRHLGSGGTLMGYGADSSGRVAAGGALRELQIDMEQTMAAKATSFLMLEGNLDSGSVAQGSVIEMGPFYREAEGASLLMELHRQDDGSSMGLELGDQIDLMGWIGGERIGAEPFIMEDASSLADLAAWIGSSLSAADPGYPVADIRVEGGRILLPGGSETIENLSLEVEGNGLVEDLFSFPESIESGSDADANGHPSRLLVSAREEDQLIHLYNAQGEPFGGLASPFDLNGRQLDITLRLGDVLRIGQIAVDENTVLGDLASALETVAGLEGLEAIGVSLGEDGQLRIRGRDGEAFEISQLNIIDAAGELDFEDSFENREIQSARDALRHTVSTDIVDSQGIKRHLALVFSLREDGHGGQEWAWEAQMGEDGEILSGGRGTVLFGGEEGGSPQLVAEDGHGVLSFEATGGGLIQTIQIRFGEDPFSVTRNDAAFDLSIKGNDGMESGTLEDIYIDETGTIQGLFSNGEMRDQGRVALASFHNSAGLERLRDNLYSESSDSGRPLWRGQASEGIAARIRSGALERSNVDLSQEFAQMITTQKGFQANAKIVTVGDEMLIEAVDLKS